MMGPTRVGCMQSSHLLGEKMGIQLIANSHTMCLYLGFLGLRRE